MKEKYIEQIKTDGYCKIPQLYSAEEVEKLLSLTQTWFNRDGDDVANNLSALTKGDHYLWNPQNKDPYFYQVFFERPIIQEILMHFLNDEWYREIPSDEPNYIMRNLVGRSSVKKLPMHIDSFIPYQGDHVYSMQVAIILEDQNTENGCTVLVPGSHLAGQYADQASFETATPIESKAGDVVLWDSRIWHGTLENNSDGTRWALIASFGRWWLKQMFNLPQSLPKEFFDKLTNSQRAVLGFCSVPYNDETEGITMKKGYEIFEPEVALRS